MVPAIIIQNDKQGGAKMSIEDLLFAVVVVSVSFLCAAGHWAADTTIGWRKFYGFSLSYFCLLYGIGAVSYGYSLRQAGTVGIGMAFLLLFAADAYSRGRIAGKQEGTIFSVIRPIK